MENTIAIEYLKQKHEKPNEKKNYDNTIIKSLEETQLKLRKQNIFNKQMQKRKRNDEQKKIHLDPYFISLNQIEDGISDDIKQHKFSNELMIHILHTIDQINAIKYMLAKLRIECDINGYIINKELSLALIKCLFTEYQPIQERIIIQYNIISIFINICTIQNNKNDFLYDTIFLVNLYSMLFDKQTPLELQIDILLLINNMIQSPELLLFILSSINLYDAIKYVYSNSLLKEEGIRILLLLVNSIISNNQRDPLFTKILNDIIPLFIMKWNEYFSSPSFSIDLYNKQQKVLQKLLKAIIILLANAFRKDKNNIDILDHSLYKNRFLDCIIEIFSLYHLPMSNDKTINQDFKQSSFIVKPIQTINKVKLPFESNESFITSIMMIIGDLLFKSGNATYDILIEKKLLVKIEHILNQLIMYNTSNHHLSKLNEIVYNITIICTNFVSQGSQYAKRFLFSSSIPSSLIKLHNNVQLNTKIQKEFISIFYNIFYLNDDSINHFYFSPQQKELSGFSILNFIISILNNTKDDETSILILDLFSLFIQYFIGRNLNKEKADFKLLLESKGICLLLEKLALSDNKEIYELSTSILTDLINEDELFEMNMKLDQFNEEDFDF